MNNEKVIDLMSSPKNESETFGVEDIFDMSTGNSVRCKFCLFESNRRCVRKNNKVKTNKPRHCDMYSVSRDKIEMFIERDKRHSHPGITVRPDEIFDGKNTRKWDGTKYKKIKEVVDPSSVLPTEVVEKPFSGDPKHPLTGDLSRFFKSTAGNEKE